MPTTEKLFGKAVLPISVTLVALFVIALALAWTCA